MSPISSMTQDFQPPIFIIGRITGGISNIDGIIQTTDFDNANVFLVNPSGIVFGPHGSFNVGGSVSFSTAQYLRLFDGVDSANFYANPANDGLANSVFAMAPLDAFGFLPVAYGFLTAPNQNATITVQGSALSVDPGQSISLVGGKVVIEDGAQLSAPTGRIHLATAASPGEFASLPGESLANATSLQSIPIDPVDPTSAFTSFGLMSLALGSSIDVHGTSTVFVKGGQLVLSVKDATLTTTSDSSANSDTISLSSGSSITTSNSGAEPGADVQITVGRLQMDGAMIQTINSGNDDGGNISINSTKVDITTGAFVLSSTGQNLTTGEIVGSGDGGNITVQGLSGVSDSAADAVTLSSAVIVTQTAGLGRGGDLHITADRLTIEGGAAIIAATDGGNGVGGDLFLNVGRLSLLGGSLIQSSTNNPGTDLNGDGVGDVAGGAGGNVTIQGISDEAGSAAQKVVLSGGSQITSLTERSGDSGRISVRATSLDLGESSTILSSTGGTGSGGDIVVEVQEASLSAQATITSGTSVNGAGGTITIQGLDGSGTKAASLDLDAGDIVSTAGDGTGRLGDIEVHAMTVSLTNEAGIQAGGEADTAKTAGNVTIDADSVSISGGSAIVSQVFTADAGQVIITATNQLTLDNGLIATNTAGPGRAGDIVLNVGRISLTNGSNISSASLRTGAILNTDGTTEPPGQAGAITINATGGFTSDASTVATSAEANHGADISITAQNVQLSNGTLITANSKAPLVVTKFVLDQDGLPVKVEAVGDDGRSDGNAGNVTIISNSNVVMKNSSVTTEASQASGGSIEINASDTGMIHLVNSKVSTSVKGVEGDSDGGNISIDPQFVILQNSQLVAQANAGAGGEINVIAGVFIADPNTVVSASSQSGPQGTVNIQSPVQNVGGELAALSDDFASAAALLAQQCAARVADGKFSTFVIAAREGLPAEPGGFLSSPSLTTELLGSRFSGRDAQTQLSAVTGLFPKYDAKPIQLAKFEPACHR